MQNNQRVILEVPFQEKDKAKDLGAWWDPDIKKWFVPAGKDPGPFEKWFSDDDNSVSNAESSREI